MNIKDILSSSEEILAEAQQKRIVPGGKEISPGRIFVTTERVIIESNMWMGLKKEYEDLHYSDIMGIKLKKNIFSSELIIKSRFQGEISIKAVGSKGAQNMQKIISEGINRYRYAYGGPSYTGGEITK